MNNPNQSPTNTLYTIGHSNHPIEHFLSLLQQHAIEVVVDIRSSPYSKYTPHFQKDALKQYLLDAGIKYLFMGRELGGLPQDSTHYDEAGHVDYASIARSDAFRAALDRLLKGVADYRVAVMCGEEDPTDCHRRLLVSRQMLERGLEVRHIRGDGALHTERDIELLEAKNKQKGQISMFQSLENKQWKSTRSVSPKKRPGNSSQS